MTWGLRALLALGLWAAAAGLGWWWRLPNTQPASTKPSAETVLTNAPAADPLLNAAAMAKRITAVDPLSLSRLAAAPPDLKPASTLSMESATWRLAALGVRGKESFAVLTAAGLPSLRLQVGDRLPDGDKIKAIHPNHIDVLSPRGRTRTLTLIEP
jgi:hypothetical protein